MDFLKVAIQCEVGAVYAVQITGTRRLYTIIAVSYSMEGGARMSSSGAAEPCKCKVGNNSLLDRWHIAREIIKHEDDLYDQRLRSLLTLHGFLFASVAVLVSAATHKDHQAYFILLIAFILVPCWVGYRTACRAHEPIQAARKQVAIAALWWTRTARGEGVGTCHNPACESYQSHFPPIIGGEEFYKHYCSALIDESKKESDRTSKQFQNLERFLKIVWLYMFLGVLFMGGIYSIFIHSNHYNQCIASAAAIKPNKEQPSAASGSDKERSSATANNTPSDGWSQHARCIVMPLSHMP